VEVESDDPTLGRGPGRLTRAFGITREHDGHDMTTPPLFVTDGPPVLRVASGPRVNVSKAAWYPLRFADADSRAVSRGPRLSPWPGRSRSQGSPAPPPARRTQPPASE
jgi:3-methyladenine DNA glycosylase Mpg